MVQLDASICAVGRHQKFDRVDLHEVRPHLKRAKRDVALSSLQSSDVGSIPAKQLSETFLRKPQAQTMDTQIGAEPLLQCPFVHFASVMRRYLSVYILMSS